MTLDKKAFRAWLETDHQIPFDLYAQNPNNWEWASEIIPGLIISSAGGMFPFQAEGLLQGLPFYYREEYGYASIRVGEENGPVPYLDSNYIANIGGIPGESRGEYFIHTISLLVPKLEKAPFYWKFKARKLEFTDDPKNKLGFVVTNEYDYVGAWGFTAEEAYKKTALPNERLSERSSAFSAERQKEMWIAKEVDPTPMNQDNRVFPNPEPHFFVNS